LLLDVSMPGLSGIELLRALRAAGDARPVVLLTAGLEDAALVEAIALGVNGIVLKEGAHNLLIPCLETVRGGERWIEQDLLGRADEIASGGGVPVDPLALLNPRERRIAELVVRGLRNREIGERIGTNEGNVKVYLHRIYRKLGISSRTEMVLHAAGRGPREAPQGDRSGGTSSLG
jgi:two-component system nitrate/nitrite response regulator NarL